MSETFGLEALVDRLHDLLVELAQDAPTGGAPAAELWARGKRAHRLRATALAATLLMVGAVGTSVGVRLADVDGDYSYPSPAGSVDIALPIEYPVGQELPSLGEAPGPLAAVWLSPRASGSAPEAVGLVAGTGTFGTLPIDLPDDDPQAPENLEVALSPDGRRVAYPSPMGELMVHDLVSGGDYSPLSEFQIRSGWTWVDATHLVGYIAGGSDVDGWVWEPGTAPKLVNPHPYLEGYGGRDLWVFIGGGGPQSCSLTSLADMTGRVNVPVLCDVLGLIGSEFVLGHWNGPDDNNRSVVALSLQDVTTYPFGSPAPQRDSQFDDPALRHVVATPEAPLRVSFATDLIGEALDAAGGAP